MPALPLPVSGRLALSVILCTLPFALAAADDTILVSPGDTVLFKVVSKTEVLSCIGTFANTDGHFDGPFSGSVRVKFSVAAEGRSNPCEITVTTPGPAGQRPVSETLVIHAVVPKVQSRTLAHVAGSSDARTTLGVGEEVMFTAQPVECLLDSDVAWRAGLPCDRVSRHIGLGTIYTAGFPRSQPANTTSNGTVVPTLRDGTDEVTLFAGGASPGGRRDRDAARYLAFSRCHTPSALAAAYRAKLDRMEAQLDTRQWSTQPTMVPFAPAEKSAPHFFVDAQGLEPALVSVATLQSRLPDGGDQPEELRAREIRLVARIVALFHRQVDPAFATTPRPGEWDVSPPVGSTLRVKVIMGLVSPEDIVEPDLRRQYRAAIAANNAKITHWYQQSKADQTDETVRRFALRYLQELCGKSDPRLKQYRRELVALGIDEHTAREFSRQPPD